MELTYESYLRDEKLREELVRRAHRERAEAMQRFFAQSAATLQARHAPAAEFKPGACG